MPKTLGEVLAQDPIMRVERSYYKDQDRRSATFDFPVSEPRENGRGDFEEQMLTLTVSYNKGGINYFNGNTDPRCYQASLRAMTVGTPKEPGGFSSRAFMVMNGLGLYRSEPVPRFNRKAFTAFAKGAVERLRVMALDEEQAARMQPMLDEALANAGVT